MKTVTTGNQKIQQKNKVNKKLRPLLMIWMSVHQTMHGPNMQGRTMKAPNLVMTGAAFNLIRVKDKHYGYFNIMGN